MQFFLYYKHFFCNFLNEKFYLFTHATLIKVWKCTYSMKDMEFLHKLIQYFIVSFIFVVAGVKVFQHFKAGKSWKELWKELFQPTPKWNPADGNLRAKPKKRQSIFHRH